VHFSSTDIQQVLKSSELFNYQEWSSTPYRVSQNLCHKLFLGISHPHLSKKVPINMGPKVNRFRDIDLCSCAGTSLSIT